MQKGTPTKAQPTRALTADLLRVILFLGVVFAHCVTTINYTPDVQRQTGLISALLHMTRYGFVAVTVFVLVLSMRGKTMSAGAFWRKRIGLVILPFLVWTVLYSITNHLLSEGNPFPPAQKFFSELALAMITGDAKYQLYFLLISIQIYIFFPALLKLLPLTKRHPLWTLLIATGIQLAAFCAYQYSSRPASQPWQALYDHAWKFLPMYTLFVAIGMVFAQHHREASAWLRRFAIPVALVSIAAGAFSIVAYLRATTPGQSPGGASNAWNPTMLPWYVGSLILLWLVTMFWDDLRQAGHKVGEGVVKYATLRAFGVFAVHPLMLDILGRYDFFDQLNAWFPGSTAVRTLVLTVVVLGLSLLFVDIALRTPLSKALVARDRIPAFR